MRPSLLLVAVLLVASARGASADARDAQASAIRSKLRSADPKEIAWGLHDAIHARCPGLDDLVRGVVGKHAAPSAAPSEPAPVPPAEPGSALALRRSAWARVLKKVFEVDPLRCPRCESEMVVIAWITDRAVIDRILEHRTKAGLESPFDARGPPRPR